MKHPIFTAGMAALLFSACSVHEMDVEPLLYNNDEIFSATIEDASTKVFADDKLRVLWDADDRVSIFNKYTYNQEYRFAGETGDNSGSFKKIPNDDFVTGNALDYVYSVYPYKESTKIDNDGVITLTLPAEQSYRENSFGIRANTMISCTDGKQLLFKNLCGYLMLKLYGDNVTVSSISLKGNNNEPLAGKATANAAVDGTPSMSFSSAATREITLVLDTPVTLGTTEQTATTFWMVVPPAVFSKGFTLTVKNNKNGVFEKTTTKNLEIGRNKLARMSALSVEYPLSIPIPEAVDMGLSVKWGSFNLGATKPEENGDYYAWGETEPKDDYSWSTYKWCEGSGTSLTKYCNNPSYGFNGFADDNMTLMLSDDPARLLLGEGWRMPTVDEMQELRMHCTWELKATTIYGYRVKSKTNNNSIFLPASGMMSGLELKGEGTIGYYWTSSLLMPDYPWYVCFFPSVSSLYDQYRCYGMSIRPVYAE